MKAFLGAVMGLSMISLTCIPLKSFANVQNSLSCAVTVQTSALDSPFEFPIEFNSDVLTLSPAQRAVYGTIMSGLQAEMVRSDDGVTVGVRPLNSTEYDVEFKIYSQDIESAEDQALVFEDVKELSTGKRVALVCRTHRN